MLQKSCSISVILSIIGTLTIPNAAIAKDIESYEDYRMHCSSIAYRYGVQSPECKKYKAIFEERDREQNNLQPRRNRIRRRTIRTRQEESSRKYKGYVGINPGAYFPNSDFLKTGGGISLYGGTKFNPNFATDVEIALVGGNTVDPGVAYGAFAAFINPRFILPFDQAKERTASLYVSPGIGISAIGVGDGDITVTDDTRLTWQTKAGISAPISNKLDIFGQVRYARQFEENTVDFFGTDLGLNLNF